LFQMLNFDSQSEETNFSFNNLNYFFPIWAVQICP
jgi:hypothetical protein